LPPDAAGADKATPNHAAQRSESSAVFIVAGVFSGLLESIPKPGPWMVWVKRVLGIVLIVWAMYFIYLGIGRM
jgi:hypothetical protein